jgi:methylmalonyl-CoA/ethylmalonyl-CoA epimerase
MLVFVSGGRPLARRRDCDDMNISNTLAQHFGPIRQLAFVPTDFTAALKFWTTVMGVGPFFYLEHLPLTNVYYRGRPIEIDCSAALAFWGDLEIELLQQHDPRPSLYQEWLGGGGTGLHHIRLGCDDLESARALCSQFGAEVAQEATMPAGGHYIMVDLHQGGPFIEFAELRPEFIEVFAHIKKCAVEWDGRDSVRRLPGDSSSVLPSI